MRVNHTQKSNLCLRLHPKEGMFGMFNPLKEKTMRLESSERAGGIKDRAKADFKDFLFYSDYNEEATRGVLASES